MRVSVAARLLGTVCCLLLMAASAQAARPVPAGTTSSGWPSWGGDLNNTRSSRTETLLSPQTVPRLQVKWVYKTLGNVSATPTVDSSGVYVTDWGGGIAKLNAQTGQPIWTHKMSDYTGNTQKGVYRSFTRNSAVLSDRLAVFGDMASATVVAVDKSNGNLVWKTQLDTARLARITASVTIYDHHVFAGVSSLQEYSLPPLSQPDFRGSLFSLNLDTGAIEWQFRTAPPGYTGNAVWGSSPVPDPKRGSLYITTGDNYTVPEDVDTCLSTGILSKEQQLACEAPDNYVDAVLALDLHTGALKWANRVQGADQLNFSCYFGAWWPGRSTPCGPDYDFGSGPNLVDTVDAFGRPIEYVGAGQKSGYYWALDPNDGHELWHTEAGPGGIEGGILWGSATDGKYIFAAITNLEMQSYSLAPDYTQVTNGGCWAAIDAATGQLLWQIAETGMNPVIKGNPATSSAALTTANGVLYAGSQSGDMVAIDGATGKILWTFASGGTVMGGPSVVDGTLYWGSGYNFQFITGKANNKLYAFSLPDNDH